MTQLPQPVLRGLHLRRQAVVSRFVVPGGSAMADSASETVLLTVPQPFANHNGGQLSFGPDGYLYIGMGDGGSGGNSAGGEGTPPEFAAAAATPPPLSNWSDQYVAAGAPTSRGEDADGASGGIFN